MVSPNFLNSFKIFTTFITFSEISYFLNELIIYLITKKTVNETVLEILITI